VKGKKKLEKKTVSGIMLTVLLIGMLTLAFNIQPVKAIGTIYIRADGSIDPPTAPISTVDNFTYTLTGNITSNADGIVVERSNIIIDGRENVVHGTGALMSSGLCLSYVSNVTINNMKIKEFAFGIYLLYSPNNIISRNNIANNVDGIWLYDFSNNNNIYHNNFVNNAHQAWSYKSTNVWDDGYPSGGNYWSDYDGADSFSGPYQNVTGSDGIGDTPYTPYIFTVIIRDCYPLMTPWTPIPGDVNRDGKVDIYDVVLACASYGSKKGDPNWNLYADVAPPWGIINIYDIVTITRNYGKTYP